MENKLPVRVRLKAAARVLFGGWGGGSDSRGFARTDGGLWPYYGQNRFDYAGEVGPLDGNSAVAICLGWIKDNFPEPVLEVQRRGSGDLWEPQLEHPVTALLSAPNPFYDGDALWAATVVSYCLDGNAYWIKARGSGGAGRPLELWFIPSDRMRPCWDAGGAAFISHYEYRINNQWQRYEVEDVVHFADGMDFHTRRGSSRLSALLREIMSDNEATTYTVSILRNMGIPGVLIGPKDVADTIPEEARKEIEQVYSQKFGGHERGKPMVTSNPIDVHAVGFSPEQMALDKIRTLPALRICSALRMHPAVVHLGVGSGPSAFDNGGQHKAAREATYEDCLLPIQRRFARTLDRQLLPDLGRPDRERVTWNYDDVRALQEDMDALSKRAAAEFAGGVARLNEARERCGYPPDEDEAVGNSYAWQLRKTEPPTEPVTVTVGRNGAAR